MKDHVVTQGECLSSIAFENRFGWQTLWNHSSNAELKSKRKNPFALAPGDVVHIPDLEPKTFDRATGARHTFVRKGVPAKLRIQLLAADGKPRAAEPYTLEIDGAPVPGDHKTDGEGWVDHFISPTAAAGILRLRAGAEQYALQLGHPLPADDLSGVQQRLFDLGFYKGSIDGTLNEDTEGALADFQSSYGLEPTGELDDATRDKLRDAFGG